MIIPLRLILIENIPQVGSALAVARCLSGVGTAGKLKSGICLSLEFKTYLIIDKHRANCPNFGVTKIKLKEVIKQKKGE